MLWGKMPSSGLHVIYITSGETKLKHLKWLARSANHKSESSGRIWENIFLTLVFWESRADFLGLETPSTVLLGLCLKSQWKKSRPGRDGFFSTSFMECLPYVHGRQMALWPAWLNVSSGRQAPGNCMQHFISFQNSCFSLYRCAWVDK